MLHLKYEMMKEALQIIAYNRKGPNGGYLGREGMSEIARKVLLNCGHDFTLTAKREEHGRRKQT